MWEKISGVKYLCNNYYDRLIRYEVSRISNSESMNAFYQSFSVSVVEKGFFLSLPKKSFQVLCNNDGTICQNRICSLIWLWAKILSSRQCNNLFDKILFYFHFFQIKMPKFWCINLLWLGSLRNKFLADVNLPFVLKM